MIPELIRRRGAVHLADEEPPADPALNPPRAVLELVPESVARENLVLPLSLDGETLTCATDRADDLGKRDKLSFILSRKVVCRAVGRNAIVAAINQHYSHHEKEQVDSMLQEFTDTAME